MRDWHAGGRQLRQAGPSTAVAALGLAVLVLPGGSGSVAAQGVGDASWTPLTSTTTVLPASLLVADDTLVFRTDATWDREQADGLSSYLGAGLRYTHEVNDRSRPTERHRLLGHEPSRPRLRS